MATLTRAPLPHTRPPPHPVKPHAVLLEIPTDGSVPEVLPWQSLRKCSFAAPHFHSDSLQLPEVDSSGLVHTDPVVPSSLPPLTILPTPPIDPARDNGWSTWTPNTEYEVERIVSATRIGGGWSLLVKWKGYPDATPEPLSKIMGQTNHPDLLSQIEKCKADYLMSHPTVRDIPEHRDHAVRTPASGTRSSSRDRQQTKHFVFSVYGVNDSASVASRLTATMASLQTAARRRLAAIRAFTPDRIW